jgi:hypothetical protein
MDPGKIRHFATRLSIEPLVIGTRITLSLSLALFNLTSKDRVKEILAKVRLFDRAICVSATGAESRRWPRPPSTRLAE